MATNNKFMAGDTERFKKGKAYVSGSRGNCVRIVLPDGTETALCTTTYSYNMSLGLQQWAAERIVAMWNANR